MRQQKQVEILLDLLDPDPSSADRDHWQGWTRDAASGRRLALSFHLLHAAPLCRGWPSGAKQGGTSRES